MILCHCFQNGVETDEVNVDDGDVQIILNPEVRKLNKNSIIISSVFRENMQ